MSIDCPFCGASVDLDELNVNDGVCSSCDHRLLPVDFDYDMADDELVLAELITDEDEAIDDNGYYDDEDLDDDDENRYSSVVDDSDEEESDEDRFLES